MQVNLKWCGIFLGSGLAFIAAPVRALNYNVGPNGNDSASGLSESFAFRTLKKAASVVNPGDTVWILTGTYRDPSPSGAVLNLTREGRPNAWIVWKAKPGQQPEIIFKSWTGIDLNASYQILDGLTVTGNNDQVTLAEAEADYAKETADPLFNGNGISVNNRNKTKKSHHYLIRNCTVRKCGGGGISAIQSDYVTVEACTVYENAWYSRYGASGISFLTSVNEDSGAGYHMVISKNRLWNNRGLIKWKKIDDYSDGNGIIIDSDKDFAYTGKSLIVNNLSVNNGGSGIHAFKSSYVDIINNTTYLNGQVVNYANCFATYSSHVNIWNNIIYAAPGKPANTFSHDTDVVYDYNIYFGGLKPVTTGTHDQIVDPEWVKPLLDLPMANFSLSPTSPARGKGIKFQPISEDIAGHARPSKSAVDVGAYEFVTGETSVRLTSKPIQGSGISALPMGIKMGIWKKNHLGWRFISPKGSINLLGISQPKPH